MSGTEHSLVAQAVPGLATPPRLTREDVLAQLKPDRPPPLPPFWPPAPGWWLALGLALALVALLLVRWRRWRRQRLLRAALAEFEGLQVGYDRTGDAEALLVGLSALLRRVAIQVHGSDVAALTGPAWAKFLGDVQAAGAPMGLVKRERRQALILLVEGPFRPLRRGQAVAAQAATGAADIPPAILLGEARLLVTMLAKLKVKRKRDRPGGADEAAL